MPPNPSPDLERDLRALQSRVAALEQTLRDYGIVPPVPRQAPAQAPIQAPTEEVLHTPPVAAAAPASQRVVPAAIFASATPYSLESRKSLENRIGSQWFNRIGILAVLIGVSWFLKLAFDNHWIGPAGRVIIGLLAGAGLIAWSQRFRSRGFLAFSYSLNALGSGILYLSLWAAFSVFHLIPSTIAFLAMVAVTAFNGFLSIVQDSELLAVYAIAGALTTPLLVSTGENHQVALFTYLLVLDLAVLALVVLRPWSRLLVMSFLGTTMFFILWSMTYYSEDQFGRTALFLAIFFLLFSLAPRLIRLRNPIDGPVSRWDDGALLIVPLLNAAFGFVGFYLLLESVHRDAVEPWLAVTFAAYYLLLLRLPARGHLHESPAILSGLHLSAAVVFLSLAIPLKTQGRWLTIGWLVEGASLFWLSTRLPLKLLRILSLLCLAIALFALFIIQPAVSTTPLFNQRFATYIVAIAVFAFVCWLSNTLRHQPEHSNDPVLQPLATFSLLLVNALILIAIGCEVHNYWWYVRWTSDLNLLTEYRMYAQFTYSAVFMLFGAALLAVGFWKRSAFLRWQALVLLAITIGKVFVYDVSTLSQLYRILSFLGLGALLLAVSFAYQRDWLHLREPEGPYA